MFGSQLYDSSFLTGLHSRPDRLHHHLPLPTNERALLVGTLHMLLGMPSAIYLRLGSRFLPTEHPLQLTHLATDTLSRCLREFAEQGSQLQFIREEGRRVYGMPNALLAAFAETAMGIVQRIEGEMNSRLKVLQQEGGRLERS